MTVTKPGPLGQLFLGAVFLLSGLAVIYLLGSDFTLTCQRADDSCTIAEDNLLSESRTAAAFKLSDLQKAEIVESRDSKGSSNYQVMLVTPQIRIPLSDVRSSSYASHNAVATQINDYLASSTPDLTVAQTGTFVTIIGLLFAGTGVVILLHFLKKLLLMLVRVVCLLTAR